MKGNHDTSGLFGRAPAPAPPAAPAGALPNTLEVERLHTVACEKVKHQLCLREDGAGGVTKTSSSSGSTFLQGAGTLPKSPFLFKLSVFDRIKIRLERDGQKMQLRQQLTRGGVPTCVRPQHQQDLPVGDLGSGRGLN